MGRKKKGNVNSRGYYTFKKTISTKFDGTPIKKVFYSKKSKADAQIKAEEYIVKQQLSIQQGDFLAAASSADYDLKVTDWEISADYDNKPALFVYYEYTNKKDTPTAFMWEFTDKVYQNGIELSSTAFGVKEENNNNSKEIQQGVTATVSIAYILQDTENPVDITVEEYNIWTKGDYIINKTLDIKK